MAITIDPGKCPHCNCKRRPYGGPVLMPSGFVDQIVYCPKCDDIFVVSEIKQDAQLALFEPAQFHGGQL